MQIAIDKINPQNMHLTYCTNIHPGEQWQEIFANLKKHVIELKKRLAPDTPFGIGLRLADVASQDLLVPDRLTQFKTWLDQQNLYVFTLNGFPYGGFHHQVVKDQVYAPDWSQPQRVQYTLRLAQILAVLLPEGMEGGISTLPLSYKPWWTEDTASKSVFHASTLNLARVVASLVQLRQAQGRLIHLDLEPEPDGLLENAAEVVAFFQNWLLPVAGTWLMNELGISQAIAETYLREHIRICYDTCHFAVEYEQPETVLTQFQAAGIQVGKVQLSAALQMQIPADLTKRQFLAAQLQPFAESTYLHQVIERHTDGTLHHYPDLIHALPHLPQTPAQEWRTHFHVPIFIQNYQVFESTQSHITALLKRWQTDCICEHWEIETYTWDVLPPAMKLDLLTSIQREYEWVLATIAASRQIVIS